MYDQQDTLKEKVDLCSEADLQFNMKLYVKLNLDFAFEPVKIQRLPLSLQIVFPLSLMLLQFSALLSLENTLSLSLLLSLFLVGKLVSHCKETRQLYQLLHINELCIWVKSKYKLRSPKFAYRSWEF